MEEINSGSKELKISIKDERLSIVYVDIALVKPNEYNPKKISKIEYDNLKESIEKFGVVDPLIVNSAVGREGVIIGGHQRIKIFQELGYSKVPIVYIKIEDINKERELCVRLSKNLGEFDFDLLSNFDEEILRDIGFSSVELDNIFDLKEEEGEFDIEERLKKLNIDGVSVKKGDIYQLGEHRLMCGDSLVLEDVLKLMDGKKADMVFTDPPYKIKGGKFGLKGDKKYKETKEVKEDFTSLWFDNVRQIQTEDFSIMVFEAWNNLKDLWIQMENFWKIRNLIIWYAPNRYLRGIKGRAYSKYDILLSGATDNKVLNYNEGEWDNNIKELENNYEAIIIASDGTPRYQAYKNKYPDDVIVSEVGNLKNSGQNIIFGTKPVEILTPYIKVMTKRGDIVVDLFGGSGSTLIACEEVKRKCYMMELVPAYMEVIKMRWEKLTGQRAVKIVDGDAGEGV